MTLRLLTALVLPLCLLFPPLASAETNRPPRVQGVSPYLYSPAPDLVVRDGKEIQFSLDVTDPDGDLVEVAAQKLPPGANFDAAFREFRWTPTAQQRGKHRLLFELTDGKTSVPYVMRFEVVENRGPSVAPVTQQLHTATRVEIQSRATDPDHDRLMWSATNLPRGATLNSETGKFTWTPSDFSTGFYTFEVAVTDGELSATETWTLDVIEEWRTYLLPGLRYSVLFQQQSQGAWHGVGVELVPVAWIHRNQNRGPSHGRVYLAVDLLRAPDQSVMLGYAAGFGLSIERDPRRTWLVPYYGAETGGLLHPSLGHHFQVTPYAGVHLWSSRNVFANLTAGYLIAPSALDALRGWRVGLGANVTLW